jgi:pilus assembly protein CpaC
VAPGAAPAAVQPGGALIVPINGTVRLQMASRRPIRSVTNPKETAVNIRTVVGDPTTVLITGQAPDVTTIDLVDVDGNRETYQVIVQLDIEYLRTQLRRAVPTANINPIPTSNNAVILAGTVDKPEDVDLVLRIAQSIGIQVINAIRVGGVQQVQLDVVVASVTRSESRLFGYDFLINSKNFFFGSTTAQAVAEPVSVGATGFGPFAFAGPAVGFPTANTNILTGVIKNNFSFLSFLQALRQEGLAKFIAEPRLVTMSGRPASFLVGGEQAVPVPAGLGQIGVQFEEFGTRLNFLPVVLGNGRIHLEVEPEVSKLNAANGVAIQGTIVPGRDTDRVNTTVELESGQTYAIGGLIQHTVQVATRKVPVLGDLPFLGVFFSSKSDQEVETELIVLVTPHLVDAQSCDQVTKVLPGQETRSPDDFELFLEGILEAPRGPRAVCKDGCYVPAYKNGPTAAQYPCSGGPNGGGGANGCNGGGCNGNGGDHGGPAGGPGHPPAGMGLTPPPAPAAAAPAVPPPPAAAAAEAGDKPGPLPAADGEKP